MSAIEKFLEEGREVRRQIDAKLISRGLAKLVLLRRLDRLERLVRIQAEVIREAEMHLRPGPRGAIALPSFRGLAAVEERFARLERIDGK